ncbi:hypothetical protein GCM10009809_28170 [Isoptericola hypogeus]|uniref:ATP-binding protein n=1 Tax=Isoptericola hypogeus TaxID=300179 RepID=A0ABP4VQI3_9MICO
MVEPAETTEPPVEPAQSRAGRGVETADPFGTAGLRDAVVAAWLASGTRFREDANAEEDHARGYYRDRVVVELAQNAADAAARAGEPGHLLLRLERCEHDSGPLSGSEVGQNHAHSGWRLVAANTGAPLDADGVSSLASLRASAKSAEPGRATHDGPVGRFGVGFAATRSVADDVAVRSVTGGVRFSLTGTRALLDEATAAGGEAQSRLRRAVAERGDDLPVLRLPFAAPGLDDAEQAELDGAATVVELALRDDAVEAVRDQLAAVDDALLLALPALASVTVQRCEHELGPVSGAEVGQNHAHSVEVRGVDERWVVRRRTGVARPEDVADLPREQRRTAWSVAWALPRRGARPTGAPADRAAGVLHAPTPTDVPLSLPGLLVASFPVDPGRRQVLPGPVTELLAAEAGGAFADLLADLAVERGADVLDLVPADLPAGELDAAIRDAATDALRATRLLPAPADSTSGADPTSGGDPALRQAQDGALRQAQDGAGGSLVAPGDATVLAGPAGDDDRLVAALAGVVPGLVALGPRHQGVARRLGAAAVTVADVVADLPAGLPPARWHALCEALEPHASDPGVLEALAGARVPLVDGRTASGVRGTVVLPEDDDDPALVAIARTLGVRVVHPDAAHPLLVRAGATPTDARALLDDDGVRALALAASEALLDGAAEVPPVADWPAPTTLVGPVDARPHEVVETALALARLALPAGPEGFPFWLGELPLPTADGELAPARETTVPGSWASGALDGLAPVTRAATARHGAELLRAVGTHADVDVYRVPDVLTPDVDDPDPEHGPDEPAGWLAGWADYLRFLSGRLGPGVDVGEVLAVADLDAVGAQEEGDGVGGPGAAADDVPDRWADVLARVAADPAARRALVTPVAGAPSYTAWWLRRRLRAPFARRTDVPLLPPVPPALAGLDDEMQRALGAVGGLGELAAADWPAALDRLPDAGTPLELPVALGVWRGLAGLAVRLTPAARAAALDPLPDRLPALDASDVVVRRADDVEVAGTARWAVLGPVLPVPAGEVDAVADLLDLPVVGEDGLPAPDGLGAERELDPRVAALDPRLPGTWICHERLSVAGAPVPWWVDAEGRAHATDRAGLAAALADVLGRPDRAALLATVLAAPDRATELWVTTAWG